MRVVAGRFQFRLRSLVCVVTAYCLWLGLQVGYLGRRGVAAGEVWGWLSVWVVWSLLAVVVGWVAGTRGHSPLVWFIAALVVNPLVAWLGIVFVNELRAASLGAGRRGKVKRREQRPTPSGG